MILRLLLPHLFVHLALHFAHFLLYLFGGLVNRDDKIEDQLVNQVQYKQFEKDPKNAHGSKLHIK